LDGGICSIVYKNLQRPTYSVVIAGTFDGEMYQAEWLVTIKNRALGALPVGEMKNNLED